MDKLDTVAYEAGRKAFNKGASLRSLVEPMMARANAEKETKTPLDWKKREAEVSAEMSLALGFADALCDKIRGIRR